MEITPYQYTIKDKNILISAFMPFLKNGGLFLKGIQLPMGSTVGIILELPGENTKYGIDSKVAWVQNSGANIGCGVHFFENNATQQLKQKIDSILMGMDRNKLPTFTI